MSTGVPSTDVLIVQLQMLPETRLARQASSSRFRILFIYYRQICLLPLTYIHTCMYYAIHPSSYNKYLKPIIKTISTMQQCHICSQKPPSSDPQPQPLSHPQILKCCIKRCNKKYCLACIRQKFDQSFDLCTYKSDTWICYSCQSLCACSACKGDKKGAKKKAAVGVGVGKLEAKIEIEKEVVVEDYYSQNQLNAAIMERRNNLFKLMLTPQPQSQSQPQSQLHSTPSKPKQEQPIHDEIASKKLKQLIDKTLKDYNNDQNDIELIQ